MVSHLVRVHVDELDYPVGVGAAGGCNQIRDRLSTDVNRSGENIGREGDHVEPSRVLALVIDQPLDPGERRIVADWLRRPGAVRDRLGRVRDVLVIGRIGCGWRCEAQLETGPKVERFRCGCRRPCREALPAVDAGFKGGDRGDREGRGVVLQVVVEKRSQDILSEPKRMAPSASASSIS